MDPRKNPYAPGAGTPPPELAGRDDLIERAAVALDREGRAFRQLGCLASDPVILQTSSFQRAAV